MIMRLTSVLVFITLLDLTRTYTLTALSRGPGVIPIEVQKSYRITNYSTYIHSINIQTLQTELDRMATLLSSKEADFGSRGTSKSMFQHLYFAQDKLDHIMMHKPSGTNERLKRGLINGLGTAISWLTGNMDAGDKEHYDQVINKIESDSSKLEHNLENQVIINRKLVNDFNRDIKIIRDNTNKISSIINNSVNDELALTQSYIFIISNLILITNRISDIDISLEFCKLGIVHNSILSPNELNNINSNRNSTLISTSSEVLWQVSKVRCSLSNTYIHYLLKIPLKVKASETLFLLSYPYKTESNRIKTMHIQPSLIIKDTILYTGTCNLITGSYYCTSCSEIKNPCINNLVFKDNNDHCIDYEITSIKNSIKYIDIVNLFLLINISKLIIVKNGKKLTIRPEVTSLLKLDANEKIENMENNFHYWESHPIKLFLNEAPVSKKLNISFDKLHEINVKMEPFEPVLDNTHVTPLVTYIGLGVALVACFGVICTCLGMKLDRSKRSDEPEPALNLQPLTSPIVALTNAPPLRLCS